MSRRELGWEMNDTGQDLWSEQASTVGTVYVACLLVYCSDGRLTVYSYVNNITGTWQTSRPPEFYGGLLADSMGLGKSCSMIALIARDMESHMKPCGTRIRPVHEASDSTKATLLVVPLSRKS